MLYAARFKAPSKKNTINMYQSPMENGLNDEKKARKMCREILHNERKAFMLQLQKSRNKRTALETIAAVIIQTIYRGFIVRHNAEAIKNKCLMRNAVNSFLIKHLSESNLPAMTTRGEHRRHYGMKRNNAATAIQCAFRCYLSRNFINRRRFEYEIEKKDSACTRIQTLGRRVIARDTVGRRRERYTLQRRILGSMKIQCQVRMMLARRKVALRRFKLRWLAARMIQGCFRGRNIRKCMAVYLAAQEKVKYYRGARALQKIIRGRIGRSRSNRIKLRFLYLKIFKAATRIQAMVRKFLSVSVVKARKQDKKFRDQIRADLILAEEKKKDAKEAESLMNSMDIFFQTKAGEVSNVDALYHSEIEGGASPEDVANHTNDMGDTILSHAAKYNQLDIVRKCIRWGYDVNHENALGDNVITLAATEGHMSVVMYMLSDSQKNAAEIIAAMPKKEKKIIEKESAAVVEERTYEENNANDSTQEGGEEKENNTFVTGQYDDDEQKSAQEINKEPEQEQEAKVDGSGEIAREEEDEEEIVIKSPKVLNLSSDDMGSILGAAAKHPDITHLKMIVDIYIKDVNVLQPLTLMTALHVACEEGNSEHVDFLIKNGAKLDVKDDSGQLPLHKSAKSSLDIMKNLLSKMPSKDLTGDELKTARQDLLFLKDFDGKDCFIISSLHGKSDIVSYITDVVDMNARVISDEVGWSENDIVNTSTLVKEGNLPCLKHVIQEGFDSSWCTEESGITISMVAAQSGRTDILEYLLTSIGADFSICDVNGMNSFHYAAQFTKKDIIPILLSADDKVKEMCKVTKSLLTSQDKSGCTPIHYSAKFGSSLSFEQLAPNEIRSAIALKDKEGLTPLLTACKHKKTDQIAALLKLGSDPKAVDNRGSNALWHYFIDITEGPKYAIKINLRIELSIIRSLLEAGCPLFSAISSPSERDMEKISNEYFALFGSSSKLPGNQREATFDYLVTHIQPTDLAAIESNLSVFNMLPEILCPIDCWGAVLSSLYFYPDLLTNQDASASKGCSKCLASLFDGNAASCLARLSGEVISGDDEASVSSTVSILTTKYFSGTSILGWSIKSKNETALTFLLRKGMSPNDPVDENGNNCLHYAVMYGTSSLVCTLLDSSDSLTSEVLYIEGENKDKYTAAMLGAKMGEFKNTQAIIQLGASPRRALNGKYWAWILAIAMQCERREINSQTGIYGDDDEMYFPFHPYHNLAYVN